MDRMIQLPQAVILLLLGEESTNGLSRGVKLVLQVADGQLVIGIFLIPQNKKSEMQLIKLLLL